MRWDAVAKEPDRSGSQQPAPDRRRGYRRIHRSPRQPVVAQRPRGAKRALPGEFEPLTWQPGRGPVTAEEALGVERGKQRAGGKTEQELLQELPSDEEKKETASFRLPARVMLFAKARAQVERTSLTAVVQAALTGYARGIPQEPEAVLAHHLELTEQGVGHEPATAKAARRRRASATTAAAEPAAYQHLEQRIKELAAELATLRRAAGS